MVFRINCGAMTVLGFLSGSVVKNLPAMQVLHPVTALFKQQLAEAQLRERRLRLLLSAGRARNPSVGTGTASELVDGSLGIWFGNHVP